MITKIYEIIKEFILENYRFFIFLFLIIFIFNFELPYVIYKPGGIIEVAERLEIEDAYKNDGKLSMSYVSLVKGTIPMLGLSYLLPNWDIIDKNKIINDDKSVDELFKLEKVYLASSIDNATILAYKKAGKELIINDTMINIVYITEEAKTNLKVRDQILEVDGISINELSEIKDIVDNHKIGDKINIKVKRDEKEIIAYATIYEKNDQKLIGISTINTYEYDAIPKINVKTKKSESGSSGGLMLTLAIYNALIEEDITKGKNIVGTGTIDIEGKVGEIDGVKYKMLAAEKNNADIFLCPKENYEEAIEVKNQNKLKLEIRSVETFEEALEYLRSI